MDDEDRFFNYDLLKLPNGQKTLFLKNQSIGGLISAVLPWKTPEAGDRRLLPLHSGAMQCFIDNHRTWPRHLK